MHGRCSTSCSQPQSDLGCAPLSPTATSASASSTGARASASRRTSISPRRRRCTARWTCGSGWSRRKRNERSHRVDGGPAMHRLVLFLVSLAVLAAAPASAGPEGQMTLAPAVSFAARWFDPAEAEGIITPFIYYYALHDALVKPMPGNPMAPSLAESWSVSTDGLTYEFALRRGVKFHNGETVSAEDAKFSFERYKGA